MIHLVLLVERRQIFRIYLRLGETTIPGISWLGIQNLHVMGDDSGIGDLLHPIL